MPVRILTLGDIVGRPGRQVVHQKLPGVVREKKIDLVIANAENVAGGSGITANLFHKLRSYGVDVITLGDHALRKADIFPTLLASERILRPANFATGAPGRTHTVVTTAGGVQVAVFITLGRIFMSHLPVDDPFAAADKVLAGLPKSVKVIVAEIHAEATSEKVAMGHHLDGRVSVVVGSHTHIPTADARVLPGGAAYQTDLGMTGPYDSILGRRKDRVLKFMTTTTPSSFDVATGDVRLCGAIVEVNEVTGKALSIGRLEVLGGNADQAYDADDKAAPSHGPD